MRTAHIVHLTSAHTPFDIRVVKRECNSLVAEGWKVTLVAPHDQDTVIDGVHVKAVPAGKNRMDRLTRVAWRIYREAVQQKAALYHFHDPELIPIGLLLRAGGKIVVYDVHEDVPSQILQMQWLASRLRKAASWLFARLEQVAAGRFSALVTAGEQITERLRKSNKRVVTLQNYPIIEEFPNPPETGNTQPRSPAIVSFGGVCSKRCAQEIVTAIGMLPEILDARMLLGGEITSSSLFQTLKKLPGWRRVHYQNLSRCQMIDQLLQAKLALVLFSPEPNHLVVRSNRFFEALTAGLPVVTSNFPEWAELVNRIGCGMTVDPEDPDAIAAAITYLLTHPDQAAEMGRRGRQAILTNLNWNREKSKLLQLYYELL